MAKIIICTRTRNAKDFHNLLLKYYYFSIVFMLKCFFSFDSIYLNVFSKLNFIISIYNIDESCKLNHQTLVECICFFIAGVQVISANRIGQCQSYCKWNFNTKWIFILKIRSFLIFEWSNNLIYQDECDNMNSQLAWTISLIFVIIERQWY